MIKQIMARKFALIGNGLKVAYQEWGVNNPKKIISFHGWLDNSSSFVNIAPGIAAKGGFHWVAIDLLGHGLSSHLTSGCGSYSPLKAVSCARQVIETFGWSKTHVVGHSMGAGISVLFAGAFPELVDRLVVIEGFGPLTHDPSSGPKDLRRAISSEMKFAPNATPIRTPKLYPSLKTAITTRMENVTSYPGKQSISLEGAAAIVARGCSFVEDPDRILDPLDDEAIGPVQFRHDPFLVLPSYSYMKNEEVQAYFDEITAHTLLITAEFGWPLPARDQAEANKRIEQLTNRGILKHVHVNGASHHLHLDLEYAPTVQEEIASFLLSGEDDESGQKDEGLKEKKEE